MAKQRKMENADRISNLPDSILSHILSFLSTKGIVRTSILSTRWIALVSNLDFVLKERTSSGNSLESDTINNFMCYVDKVLFMRNTNIEKFRLKCVEGVDHNRIFGWIDAAIWRGVQHLDLNISFVSVSFIILPVVRFACKTLTTLKLDGHFFVFQVPESIHFPNLKTLHLTSVGFLGDAFDHLLSGCNSLEDLVMEKCCMYNIPECNISLPLLRRLTIVYRYPLYVPRGLMIDTPNLAYLKYHYNLVAKYSLKNLQSLVKADIDFQDLNDEDLQGDATTWFREISNVCSLILSASSLKLLSSCQSIPIFPKLAHLKICHDPSRAYYNSGRGLADLLTNSYELEEFAFYQEAVTNFPQEVPLCMLSKLKVIEISEFKANQECIRKAKYFLRNAAVLKKLTVRTISSLSDKQKLRISRELLAYPRQSCQCCILIV